MSELIGQDLDQAVAEAIGIADIADTTPRDSTAWLSVPPEGKTHFFRPSTGWHDGGPLIERFGIETQPDGPGMWAAYIETTCGGDERCAYEASGHGPTLLIAAMRALVEWHGCKRN
jgi:hypothetical protein